jgi:CheY-like chemotaxis protein
LVTLAENGLDALEKVKEKQRDFFDAIVLDVRMPIMNGFEACVLIREYIQEMGVASMINVSPNRRVSSISEVSNDTIRVDIRSAPPYGWKMEKQPLLYCLNNAPNQLMKD